MLLPDSRTTAFELIRPPSGYRLDFAVLTTYTLDLEALLVLPLSMLAHPEGGLEELLADPLGLHQAIRDAGDRVHAFVDETGIGIPRRARPLYSMLESSVHAVRAPDGGAFHPKVWVVRFTAVDETAEDLLRVAVLSRNLTFHRSWDVALASEAPLRDRRRVAASRPLADFIRELPQLATNTSRIPRDVAERVEELLGGHPKPASMSIWTYWPVLTCPLRRGLGEAPRRHRRRHRAPRPSAPSRPRAQVRASKGCRTKVQTSLRRHDAVK